MMRSILVHADRSSQMTARLETALALARTTDGHVTILVDTPVARYISMDPMGGSYVATDALQQALADDDSQAGALEERLRGEDVPFDVTRAEAEPVEALAAAARLADVVVVSRGSGIAGELALAARTPVLVVPDDRMLDFPVGNACVAWDGSDESALALRAATGLLRAARTVKVLTVAEKRLGFPATDALRYLSRHGVTTELVELEPSGSTEETLALGVAKARTDLLVMGAYGHSRMRQLLFGGVTRYFLEDSAAPALLLVN